MPGKSKFQIYRFELVKGRSFVLDTFNLVLPPQTLSYDGRYRDSVMKTFEGTHVDVQGMDNEVIKLSGTVGGKRARRGWGKSKGTELTNVAAIKYFRDKIWKYPDNPKYRRFWKQLHIKFYDIDLSEVRWVHIDNVVLTRDKAQPFWWFYSISMIDTGEPRFDTPSFGLFNTLAEYKQKLQGVVDAVQELTDKVVAFTDLVDAYADTAFGFADATVQAVTNVTTSLRELSNAIINAPERLLERLNDTITGFRDAADELDLLIVDNSHFNGKEYGEYLRSLLEETRENARLTAREFAQIGARNQSEAVQQGILNTSVPDEEPDVVDQPPTPIVTKSTQKFVPQPVAIVDGQQDSVEQHVVVEGETLEKIALELYGNADMAQVLAALNNLQGSFLSVGTVLLCPVYREQSEIPDNLVIAEDGNDFGRDVGLTEQGMLQVSSTGDLLTVTGWTNIVLVVRNILARLPGTLPSNELFGFDVEQVVGAAGTGDLYGLIEVKIREALLQDPRIADIAEFEYRVEKDAVRVSGKIVMQNGMSLPFQQNVA